MNSRNGSSLFFLSAIALLVAFYFARPVFIPLVLAAYLAVLLDPTVCALERVGLTRTLGTAVVVSMFLLFVGVVGWVLVDAVSVLGARMPEYGEAVRGIVQSVQVRFDSFGRSAAVIEHTFEGVQRVRIVDDYSAFSPTLMSGVGSLFSTLGIAVFVPLLLYYLLAEKPNIKESINTLIGRFSYIPKLDREIPHATRVFFVGNLIGAIALVATHIALFELFGLERPLALGLTSGILNLLPIIGIPASLTLPFLQGLLQFSDPWPFAALALSVAILHFVIGNLVIPRFVGRRANINTTALILGILFWGWLWGPVGFLLAVPLTSTLKTLLESSDRTALFANLLAARPRSLRRPAAQRRAAIS